jgi:hypothetical protein
MSYDLEVRSDADHSRTVPLGRMASVVRSLPGVAQTGPTSFVLDRVEAGIHLNIDVGHGSEDERPPAAGDDPVSLAALLVPYAFLDRTAPVALEMAFRIAEELGWSVYDPQGDHVLTRQDADLTPATGTGDDLLERAASAPASLGALFEQEMWNHGSLAAVGIFVAVAVGGIALLIAWGWSREQFDRYFVWVLIVGALGLLWLKGLAQAYRRRHRPRTTSPRR